MTMENTNLVAELQNGDIIKTEEFIDNPKYNRGLKIKSLARTKLPGLRGIAKSNQSADCIILSPGSLYTSLIARFYRQA